MSFAQVHSLNLPLHLPDLPGPGIGGVQGIPVAVHRLTFRQHFGANGMDEGIDVDRYKVVLLNEDTLDLLDQTSPFVQVEAGLMFRPQGLDLWLADERGRAATHGVDTNVGLGATRSRVNVLDD